MSESHQASRTQAQISRSAIQRLYISMRHLILRGAYKPLGVSGETMIQAMLSLKPEIYGTIADDERVELDGLLYIFQRLPKGIEQCRYIKLISREGYDHSHFEKHVPPRRKRDCYRVDVYRNDKRRQRYLRHTYASYFYVYRSRKNKTK